MGWDSGIRNPSLLDLLVFVKVVPLTMHFNEASVDNLTGVDKEQLRVNGLC